MRKLIYGQSYLKPNQSLGHIGYDRNRFVKAVDPQGSDRPAFSGHVTRTLQSEEGAHRCHSYSFEDMQSFLLAVMNCYGVSQASVNVIKTFMNIFGNLGDDVSRRGLQFAGETMQSAFTGFAYCPFPAQFYAVLSSLNLVLYAMNSVTGNLRFPGSGAFGNEWNMSIHNNYDPMEWCYVQGNNVISNHLSTEGEDINEWFRIYAHGCAPVGDGFYLLSDHDSYLLNSIFGFNQLNPRTKARLVVATGKDYDTPIVYSSSNTFPLPGVIDYFKDKLHVLSYGMIGAQGPGWYWSGYSSW